MNPTREEALFALTLEKPAEKCAAFLEAECEGGAALRQRLEALLAAHEQPATELAGKPRCPTRCGAVRRRQPVPAAARRAVKTFLSMSICPARLRRYPRGPGFIH